MRILIAANHYPVASGRYMADAFRRLGHEVETIGAEQGNHIWGITVDSKHIWNPSVSVDPTPPDLVIVMDSDPTIWEMVKRHSFKCPVVVYGVDNHVRSYESDLFVHQFLAHYHGPAYPVDPARADHSWLPCASDPMFTPSPIAWEDRAYDVACVGVMYPRRQEVIDALKDAGLKVFAATGLLYEEYRAAYWNARISLCVSAAGDVAQRVFETGRMGCAILTDPLLDFADEETNKALGIYGRMTYTSPAEAAVLARDLLGSQQAFNIGVPMQQSQEPMGKGAALQLQAACMPHTWDARAKVIVDWFEKRKDKEVPELLSVHDWGIKAEDVAKKVDEFREQHNIPLGAMIIPEDVVETEEPKRYPFLNLGCGTTHFPGERPPGHEFIDASIYQQPLWLNVDKVEGVGADKVFDLFAYPWPLEDNSFDGAVLGHICEHIPHGIDTSQFVFKTPREQWTEREEKMHLQMMRITGLQDGWYAFFAELYRVLTPGAIAHIISPYAWSEGAVTDPTHTRYLTVQTFTHGLSPEQYTGTFKYNIDCNFQIVGHQLRYTSNAQPFMHDADLLQNAVLTRVNMVYDFYVQLKAVK